jgi:carbon monoxide dehydrogenase subunit G
MPMDHEVFVPVAAGALRRVLRDPARVARCLPAFQADETPDAARTDASGPVAGRLKVRAGGHTITYRGTFSVTERDGVFTATGEGEEVRGSGSVRVGVRIVLTQAGGTAGAQGSGGQEGTRVALSGTAGAAGRLAELPEDAAGTAGRRLLEKFAAGLAVEAGSEESTAGTAGAPAVGQAPEQDGGPREERADATGDGADETFHDETFTDEAFSGKAFDSEDAEDEGGAGGDFPDETVSGAGDFSLPDDFGADDFASEPDEDEPPAEAAHARRTMIGRSAEEVDHAPPRGRYAPVPLPEAAATAMSLRWVAPAAVLAVASAVVVTRVLRRRH